jgi:hypothetical protein
LLPYIGLLIFTHIIKYISFNLVRQEKFITKRWLKNLKEHMEWIMTKDNTPTRFKVELEMNKRVFTQVYFATHLTDLFNQIADEFPKAKILSVIGGGGTAL